MCGIHGYVRLDGAPVDPSALTAMGRVTAHRGPDDEGLHIDGSCAHRHATPVDHRPRGRPSAAPQRGRPDLARVQRRNLQLSASCAASSRARGHSFLTHSDCEVIIPLYRELGRRSSTD